MITNEALHKKTPQEITALLYEACLDNLDGAKVKIEEKDHLSANDHLKKASDILYRLGAGINYEAGIIADQLDTVYNYLADKIIEANVTKDSNVIDEVSSQLQEISIAWNKAMKENKDKQSKVVRQKTNAYEQAVMYES